MFFAVAQFLANTYRPTVFCRKGGITLHKLHSIEEGPDKPAYQHNSKKRKRSSHSEAIPLTLTASLLLHPLQFLFLLLEQFLALCLLTGFFLFLPLGLITLVDTGVDDRTENVVHKLYADVILIAELTQQLAIFHQRPDNSL